MFVCRRHSLLLGHKKKRKTVKILLIIRHFLSWYGRCLESYMHRTGDSKLLFLLSGLKSIRQFSRSPPDSGRDFGVRAGSVLTLAMVRYDQSPAWTPAVTRNNSAANLLCYDVSAPRFQYRLAVLKLDNQNATDFSFDSRLEKQSGSQSARFVSVGPHKIVLGRADGQMDGCRGRVWTSLSV